MKRRSRGGPKIDRFRYQCPRHVNTEIQRASVAIEAPTTVQMLVLGTMLCAYPALYETLSLHAWQERLARPRRLEQADALQVVTHEAITKTVTSGPTLDASFSLAIFLGFSSVLLVLGFFIRALTRSTPKAKRAQPFTIEDSEMALLHAMTPKSTTSGLMTPGLPTFGSLESLARTSPDTVLLESPGLRTAKDDRFEALLDGRVDPRMNFGISKPRKRTAAVPVSRLEALLDGRANPHATTTAKLAKRATAVPVNRLEAILDGRAHPRLTNAVKANAAKATKRLSPLPLPVSAPSSSHGTAATPVAVTPVAASPKHISSTHELGTLASPTLASPELWRDTPVIVVAQHAAPVIGASQALPSDDCEAVRSAQEAAKAAAAAAEKAYRAYQRAQERQALLVASAESRARMAAAEDVAAAATAAANIATATAAAIAAADIVAAAIAPTEAIVETAVEVKSHVATRSGGNRRPGGAPLLKRSTTIYDAQLRLAWMAVGGDTSRSLAKRQLYAALARVDLALEPAEQLKIWQLFDRDGNGRVEWEEVCSFTHMSRSSAWVPFLCT